MRIVSSSPLHYEIFEKYVFLGIVYGTIRSLPLTLWIIYRRKIPLINRRQLTKEQSFIIRGLTKKDWKFLLKYIPSSYFIYMMGQIMLAYFLGSSEPVNQMAVESLFDYVPHWQMFIMIVIVAPIAEELLFRGICPAGASRRPGPRQRGDRGPGAGGGRVPGGHRQLPGDGGGGRSGHRRRGAGDRRGRRADADRARTGARRVRRPGPGQDVR